MAFLFLLVPVFLVMFRLRLKRQAEDMARFAVDGKRRESQFISMEPWRLGLLLLATSLVILGLMRPAVNPHAKMIPREGRDVVFLLDVSRSMLAEDRLPNRLQSAKNAIAECVDTLDGNRIGLVVFAGSSSIVCPLTMDRDFFMESLQKAGPDSVAHGGTRIADALLKVSDKLFSKDDNGYKDIILITDGGDQGKGLEKAAQELNKKQIRLIAIGLGDERQGARVPAPHSKKNQADYTIYKGQVVWSRLDSQELTKLVKLCDHGAYLPVATRRMDLGQIYHRLIEHGGSQQLAEESVIAYDDIFQWFMGGALFLLMLMILIPHTRQRSGASAHAAFVPLLLLVVLVISSPAATAEPAAFGNEPQDALACFVEGNQEYRTMNYAAAESSYQSALDQHPSGRLLRAVVFNLGNTYFKLSKSAETSYEALSRLNQSIAMYRKILRDNPDDQDAAVNNELVRIARRKCQAQIRKDEERRKQLQSALDAIRTKLTDLIRQQSQNLPVSDTHKKSNLSSAEKPPVHLPDGWVKNEQDIATGTAQAGEMLDAMNRQFFKGMPAELTPVRKSQEHVSTALKNQLAGIRAFPTNQPDAHANGRASLHELQAALEALPQQVDQEGQPSDEEEDDGDNKEKADSNEGEGAQDGDQNSEDGKQGDMEDADSMLMDLKSIELPPPSNSPEDIIRMNKAMQAARQAAQSKRKGKPVEKNW